MRLVIGRCLIPELLRSRGWTLQDLANRTGISKKTLSAYSTGRIKRMPIDNAIRIADAFGVHPRDVYEWITEE